MSAIPTCCCAFNIITTRAHAYPLFRARILPIFMTAAADIGAGH